MHLSKLEVIAYVAAVALFAAMHVFFAAPFWFLYVAVACAAIVISLAWRRRTSSSKYASMYSVACDEREVIVSFSGKRRESVAWDDLLTIGIRIENEGFLPVPFWLLGGRSGGCMYPSDAVGQKLMLSEFKNRLPGFANPETYAAIVKAMGATTGGVLVWQRSAARAA